MKIVLVVAGNKSQFDSFLRGFSSSEVSRANLSSRRFTLKDGTEYVYMSDPVYMKGFHGVEVRFIGTFNELPNLEEFEREARVARMK